MLLLFYHVILFTIHAIHGQTSNEGFQKNKKTNIVFMVAEDLGWDDVGFHGSPQIPTPTMDEISKSGVLLNSYYVSPSPFATKCEIMTGKYAAKLGVQHPVFHNKQPTGLPEGEKILPEYLKELGYSTHAVGKWGLGFYKENLLPWKRGFNTFYGGLTSSTVDYFTHSGYDDDYGLDMRRNQEVVHNETGRYVTELYTKQAVQIIERLDKDKPFFLYVSHQAVHSGNVDDPLQVPQRYLSKLQHIKNPKRKLFAGMVSALDESLLNITIALSDHDFMENTVIIFTSVSGAAVGGMELSSGSNYPLRGSKLTVWEGGLRASAFVYSDSIVENSFVNEEMFHSTDWLPTILGLAGGDASSIAGLDGFNVWDAMTHREVISPRFEILHQYDPLQKNECSLRVGDYKIIINQDIGYYGDWFPRPAEVGELRNLPEPEDLLPNAKLRCDKNYPHPFLEMHAPPCDPMKKPCLFNIEWDPCEFHNLAEFMPNTLKVLRERLQYYYHVVKKPSYPRFDPKSDPENNDGVWGPWEINTPPRINSTKPSVNNNQSWENNIQPSVNNSQPWENNSKSWENNDQSWDNNNSPENVSDSNATTIAVAPNYPVQSERFPSVLVPGTSYPANLTVITNMPLSSETYHDIFNHTTLPIVITLPPEFPNASEEQSENKTTTTQETPLQPSQLLQMNSTTTYPNDIYPNMMDLVNYSQQPQTKTKDLSHTTPTTPLSSDELYTQRESLMATPGNSTANTTGDSTNSSSANTNGDKLTMHLKSNTLNTTSFEESGAANKNFSTTADIQTKMAAAGEFLGATLTQHDDKGDAKHQTKFSSHEIQTNKDQSKNTATISGDMMQYGSLDTSSAQTQDTTIIESGPVAGQYGATPSNTTNTSSADAIHSTGNDQQPISNTEDVSARQEQRGSGQVMLPLTNQTAAYGINDIPAKAIPPKSASLKSPKVKEEGFGTGAGSSTSSESSAGGGAATKIDSDTSSIKDPYYSAELDNIADAGQNGPHGMNSTVTMTSGEKINTKEMPAAEEFIKQPTYNKISQPAMNKPDNGVINPFEAPKDQTSMELGAGAGAGAGAGSESEASAGSLADTMASLKGKNQEKKKESSDGKQGKNLNEEFKTVEQQLQEGGQVTKSFHPQDEGKSIEEDPFYIITNTGNITAGTSTSAGSVSESQVGAFGGSEAGSNASSDGSSGQQFVGTPQNITNSSALTLTEQIEGDAQKKLASSLPNSSIHIMDSGNKNIHVLVPASSNQRPFQSVSDVVSDSSNQLCADGRDCINKQIVDGKIFSHNENATSSATNNVTEATSNDSLNNNTGNSLGGNGVEAHNHAFKAQVWMDKKKFYIVGTASEIDNQTTSDESAKKTTSNSQKSQITGGIASAPAKIVGPKKQNIGFNVMLPATVIKQLAGASPKFKDHSSIGNNKGIEKASQKNLIEQISIHHPKSKSTIRKVLDMITDPERTRKTHVPEVPDILTTAVKEPDTYDQLASFKDGEAGDIGAMKPVSRGTVIELKNSEPSIKESAKNKTVIDTGSSAALAANVQHSSRAGSDTSGDLGSIVTLVGKAKQDRLSSKRMKQTNSSSSSAVASNDEKSGDKKSTTNSDYLASKHSSHNATTSSETNAANINQMTGPSNSIIVSSVIVVLIAAFVVVGMAVVAVVAVVARHCHLGKHIQVGS